MAQRRVLTWRLGLGLGAAFVLMGVMGVGCGASPECPSGKVCLRYMAWGNPEQIAAEQKMLDRFNAKNPDIHVRLLMVPNSSYIQKAMLMLASRTAPDVLRIDHYRFPQLVEKNYFVDLTPYAKADPDFRESDFFSTALQECTYKDRLYALSVLFGSQLIYYNKDLVKQAGLEDPYVLFKRGEWTWDKYREYAQAMTTRRKNGEVETYGTLVPSFPATAIAVWEFGGEMMSPDMRTSRVDDPNTIRAYQFLADLIWKDKVAPTPADTANNAFAFEGGRVGMYFDWMGIAPRLRGTVKDFDWDACPPPRGPKGLTGVVKGNQLVIAANSKHPKEAWRFMRFLTSVEGENYLASDLRRTFPSRISVAHSKEYLTSEKPPHQMSAFLETVNAGRTLPIDSRWDEWTNIFNMEVDNLMAGRERDAGAVLRRAKVKIDKALSEDPGF